MMMMKVLWQPPFNKILHVLVRVYLCVSVCVISSLVQICNNNVDVKRYLREGTSKKIFYSFYNTPVTKVDM